MSEAISDAAYKAQMMDNHWNAVRLGLARHLHLSVLARARSVQAPGPVNFSNNFIGGSDDFVMTCLYVITISAFCCSSSC